MHLSEGEQSALIAAQDHLEVKREEYVIETAVPGSSVDRSEDAMSALATLQRATYPFCLLSNIDLSTLVEEQEIKHGSGLAVPVDLDSPIDHTTSGLLETTKLQLLYRLFC